MAKFIMLALDNEHKKTERTKLIERINSKKNLFMKVIQLKIYLFTRFFLHL